MSYGALGAQLHVSDLEMLGSMNERVGRRQRGRSRPAPGLGPHRRRGLRHPPERHRQPREQRPRTGFQAGTDLWASTSWRAGVYVGQLDGEMNVFGFASGIPGLAVGSNDLRSQYVGAYATWRNQGGFYVDTVLQSGRHRYTVEPEQSLRSEGKGDSLAASVEVGDRACRRPREGRDRHLGRHASALWQPEHLQGQWRQ